MHEIIGPHCSNAFKIDETGYADIPKQVRDSELDQQLHDQLALAEQEKINAVELAKPGPANQMDASAATSAHPVGGFEWSENLLTGDARMDHTHTEFADQLKALMATPAADQMPVYQALLHHTVAHFAQEDRWMRATGFAPNNCHSDQHAMILETMQAVVAHYQQGETDIINRMGEALGEWFTQHALSMDAGLAQHLQSVGFDSATETLGAPQAAATVAVLVAGDLS